MFKPFTLLWELPTASVSVSDCFLAFGFLLLNQFGFESSADVRCHLCQGVVALGQQGIKDRFVLGKDRVKILVLGDALECDVRYRFVLKAT